MNRSETCESSPAAVQVSFAPFLLPGTVGTAQLHLAKQRIIEATGLREGVAHNADLAILGDNVSRLCGTIEEIPVRLYVSHLGVGVMRIDWPACTLASDPKKLLQVRRDRHSELIEGSTPFGGKVHAIVNAVVKVCKYTHLFKPDPYRSAAPFDYVFSMFEIDADCQHEVVRVHEEALLSPSRFGLSDTTWAPELPNTQQRRMCTPTLPENCEDSDTVCCRASWASVVISGRECGHSRELYAAIEVRTQALWLFAHRVSRVRPTKQRGDLLTLELLAFTFEQLVTSFLPLDEPTANERVLAINKAIVSSSDVFQRVEAARQNISSLRAITSAQETRHRNQLESITQILLFLIASLQLLPTIIPVPLAGNFKVYMIVAWVVAFIAFLGVRVRLR